MGWGLKLVWMRETRMQIFSDIDCIFHEMGRRGVDCGVQQNYSELQLFFDQNQLVVNWWSDDLLISDQPVISTCQLSNQLRKLN